MSKEALGGTMCPSCHRLIAFPQYHPMEKCVAQNLQKNLEKIRARKV
jgi:hypothetical protein